MNLGILAPFYNCHIEDKDGDHRNISLVKTWRTENHLLYLYLADNRTLIFNLDFVIFFRIEEMEKNSNSEASLEELKIAKEMLEESLGGYGHAEQRYSAIVKEIAERENSVNSQ